LRLAQIGALFGSKMPFYLSVTLLECSIQLTCSVTLLQIISCC